MFHVCFKRDFDLKDVFRVKPGANFTRIRWQEQQKTIKFCLFEKKCLKKKCLKKMFVWKTWDKKGFFDFNPIRLIASFCWEFLERRVEMESTLSTLSVYLSLLSQSLSFSFSFYTLDIVHNFALSISFLL